MLSFNLGAMQRTALLNLARKSIHHFLENHRKLPLNELPKDPALQTTLASFVTLYKNHSLRGCVGHLRAVQPLAADVAENAISSATRDHRFPPVTLPELREVQINISVLGASEKLDFHNESDLFQKLRVGEDGLILRCHSHEATFLPSVWSSLTSPEEFVEHLKIKAGLSASFWSTEMEFFVYQTFSFSED